MYTYHALYISLNLWQPPWGHKGIHLVGNLTCWRWKSRFRERTWVLDGIVKPLLNQPPLSPNLPLNFMWYKKIFPAAQFNWVRVFSFSRFFFGDWTNPKLYFLFMNLLNVPMCPPFTWPHEPFSIPTLLKIPSLLSYLSFLPPHGWLYFPKIIAIIFLPHMLC